MKKSIILMLAVLLAVVGLVGCAGAGAGAGAEAGTGTEAGAEAKAEAITVISREEGSGTRGAFIELFGIEQKNGAGEKEDHTIATADQTNSTGVMLQSVAQNEAAIGYVSLGSLNDTVKALAIDGAAATVENIESGSYQVARPFLIATKAGTESELAQDFIAFILSSDGQAIVTDKGYIAVSDNAAYDGGKPAGKLVVAGSSSVSPVMEKLIEAYVGINPSADIELQTSDSSTGLNGAVDGVCDIAMASRELKDSEVEAGLTPTVIATDGIAVIVNLQNEVDGLTSEQVKAIYTGEVTDWSGLK